MNCTNCPFKDKQTIPATERTFFNEGVPMKAKMKSYNDAFYEITEGKFKGCLVHTFNVVK